MPMRQRFVTDGHPGPALNGILVLLVLAAVATFGFLAAGLLASWYLIRKGDAPWLFLALAVIVSLIKESNDVRAALVSFAAITVITLGLLRWRQWWAVDAAVAAFVLLTLLFARDAYLTLGMLLLVASGGMVAALAVFGVPRQEYSTPGMAIRE